jgi:hypothetical protein
MSLANENDLIIPGTVGIISAAVKEANRHLDRYREHIVQDENKNKNIAEYIREMPKIHYILQNRINGVALDKLVTPTRISNDVTRSVVKKEETEEKEQSSRVYEDWFRG